MDLQELEYKHLANPKKVKTMDDLKRAAHSQGYEVTDAGTHKKYGSHGTVELRHRKSGERVQANKDRGSIGGKKVGKGGEIDNTTRNTVADALKADMRKRGRVDKTDAAKAKRKSQMNQDIKDKVEKQKKQSKSPRNMEKVKPRVRKTFEEFMMELDTVL